MYKVPCGNNMGHGSSCTEGYLCNACLHIEELEAQERKDIRKISKLEAQLAVSEDDLRVSESGIKELEAQLAEKEKLLKEIVPLIPDFNFALEHNPAIANYAYLKAAIKGDES